ncbi:MAG: carbohydrate ABC transporter permease [Candidatus Limnocylindria bacterium]
MASRVGVRPDPAIARHARAAVYPYLLTGPAVLLVGLLVLYPLAYVGYLSLHDYSPFRAAASTEFVALAQFARALTDPDFWHSLGVSAVWVTGSVVPQFLLGLGMALLLNERFKGRGAIRTIILMPWVVSGVVTGIIWLWLFDGTVGVFNDILQRIGLIASPVAWGLQAETTFFMVFVANAWRGAPFFAIVLLAALQGISPEVHEAATVDGAGRWARFRHITLPLILNAVIISTMLRVIWTFNYIDLLWTMTQGGPLDATQTLPLMVFQTAYRDGDFGYAAALVVLVVGVLLAFTALYWRLNRFAHMQAA